MTAQSPDNFCAADNAPTQGLMMVPGRLLAQIPEPESFTVGSIVGERYCLEALIAQGGMGSVFSARHLSLNKKVAVKILRAEFARSEPIVRRFHQEARAASALTHPGLVSVCDHGVSKSGTPYLVMEFAEGNSVAQILKAEQTIAVPRALNMFLQICDALSYAHSKGVIHRDLKPGNIMIMTLGSGFEIIKIVDFGIAKLLAHAQDAQSLTQTGEIFGSPLYMSPEQCLANEVDIRSDIYSLGCVMYQSLAGFPPFTGESSMQTMYKHISMAPSFDNLSKQQIPVALESVIHRALEKDPAARYQSAAELKRDLLLVKAGAALPASRMRRWFKLPAVRKRLIMYPLVALISCWLGATVAVILSMEQIFTPPPWKRYVDSANTQMLLGNTELAKYLFLRAIKTAEVENAREKAHALTPVNKDRGPHKKHVSPDK